MALAKIPDIQIVGSVWSGEKALESIRSTPPDLVTLDQEMPEMDGLSTLREIKRLNEDMGIDVSVVMLSSHTQRGGEVTMNALNEGALDFIAKPSGADADANMKTLVEQLQQKIEICRGRKHRSAGSVVKNIKSTIPKNNVVSEPSSKDSVDTSVLKPKGHGSHVGGKVSGVAVQSIAIGVSTGGPKALQVLVPELCKLVDLPIFIVQHMPPQFTKSLAQSLDRISDHTVVEAEDGLPVAPKMVYVAPGGLHLLVRKEGAGHVVKLSEQDPENGFRPSADVLFRSVASAYGSSVLALILTGMGSDGAKGLASVKRQGSTVFAQDEASSVVWGMPGSAVEAGVVDEVLPLAEMAQRVSTVIKG